MRAVTRVSALVLSHDDMRWAIAHDYRQSDELTAALRARKLCIVRALRAERAARRAAGTAEDEGIKAGPPLARAEVDTKEAK